MTRLTDLELQIEDIPEHAAARRIRNLHSPEWFETSCNRPRKGCDRDDCTLRNQTLWGANRYMHEYGYQVCSHCTSGGDPFHYVSDEYPCPTIQALDGVTIARTTYAPIEEDAE